MLMMCFEYKETKTKNEKKKSFYIRGNFKPNRQLTGRSIRFRSLFRTTETGRNRTEPPVNRWLSFEAVPNESHSTWWLKVGWLKSWEYFAQ